MLFDRYSVYDGNASGVFQERRIDHERHREVTRVDADLDRKLDPGHAFQERKALRGVHVAGADDLVCVVDDDELVVGEVFRGDVGRHEHELIRQPVRDVQALGREKTDESIQHLEPLGGEFRVGQPICRSRMFLDISKTGHSVKIGCTERPVLCCNVDLFRVFHDACFANQGHANLSWKF